MASRKPESPSLTIPAANNKGNGGTGTTDDSGEFTLKFRDGQEGIPAGDYVVMFSKLTQKDGSPIPEGQTAADVQAVDKIPERYRLTENPPLHREGARRGKNGLCVGTEVEMNPSAT